MIKPLMNHFHESLESIQDNATIAITGAIRRTPSEKFLFYNVFHEKSSSYLIQLFSPSNNVYAARKSRVPQSNKIPSFKIRHNFCKDFSFPAVISEWNSLDINIRNSSSIICLRKNY